MDAPVRNLAGLARHHFGRIRLVSFVLGLLPAAWLSGEWLAGALGVNPLNRLLRFTGSWALVMLMVTLAVTPARRLSVWISQTLQARHGRRVLDWNWLIRLRRQFGLFCFFYACLHLSVYVAFDAGLDLASIRDDALQRPFVCIGLAAFGLLIPLAATSNPYAIRALKRNWRRLHTLTYLIAVLALAHFWFQMKVGETRPWPDSIVVTVLLASRLWTWLKDRDTGVEVKER